MVKLKAKIRQATIADIPAILSVEKEAWGEEKGFYPDVPVVSSPHEARKSLNDYFNLYNNKRIRESLNYKTLAEIYFNKICQRSAKFYPMKP